MKVLTFRGCNGTSGICDTRRHIDRDTNGERDHYILGISTVADCNVERGKGDHNRERDLRDGVARLCGHTGGQLALARPKRW